MPEHDVENRVAVFGWPSCSKPLESITFVILDQPHPTSSRSVRRAYNMGSTVRSKKMAVSEPSGRLPAAMSRPCERRDPSVSAIALIAAARTLVSALEQRPFFTFEARSDDGVDGPLRHRDVPE